MRKPLFLECLGLSILALVLLVSCHGGPVPEPPEAPPDQPGEPETLGPVPGQGAGPEQGAIQQLAAPAGLPPPPEVPAPPPVAQDLKVTGPYTHRNLAVYLVHGADQAPPGELTTLAEALAAEQAKVHETGTVNALAVENLSATVSVFIQAGEIVRGGKQDRVLAVDMVLPPASGQVPISAFCVESGRWVPRGQESSAFFASSSNLVMGNHLKLAVQQYSSQSMVWSGVKDSQAKLSLNTGAAVEAEASPTSLELTLEHAKVQEGIAEYTQALQPQLADQSGVIGLAVAVNGALRSADVYGCSGLFASLRGKLLEAAATEALSVRDEAMAETIPTAAQAQAWLGLTEQGQAVAHQIAADQIRVTRDRPEEVMFEARLGDLSLHRSYLKK